MLKALTTGNASDAVRDQMMRHDPKFATFQGAYLNENVQFDLQNTFLEEETEEQMYKVFAHVSLTRDPRATRDMVPKEVWENLPPDPEIVELEQQRQELKGGQYRVQGEENEAEIRRLTEEIRTKRDQRDKSVVKEYLEYHLYNRPTWDIERQANGE
ncbi:FluG domain-containing protein, partial [Colletotrichum abscissum]|uniref:FluG domain-containing protein n=1 Tax=Colletotrichum abscissum TaxID=1671311 RepID=UPI0027D4B003